MFLKNVVLFYYLSIVSAQECVIVGSGYRFTFTELAGKQIGYIGPDGNNYVFTFCGSIPCGDRSSTICQSNRDRTDFNDLGSWLAAVDPKGADSVLNVTFGGGDQRWCAAPRITNVVFQCVDGDPQLLGVSEVATCEYAAQIRVPRSVCQQPNACCTPPTYSASRMEDDGTIAAYQADAATGNWFDGNYQATGLSMLCLKEYSRCFSFNSARCAGADYRPAPRQCFGNNVDNWRFVKSTWVGYKNVPQRVWYNAKSSSYAVTIPVPIDSDSDCLVMSGNKDDSSFEFTTTTNSSLWEIPKICLKWK